MKLWNGQPFKNYWNELSVEKRTEFIEQARLKNEVKNNLEWGEIQTHHQALLRDVLRRQMN